MTSETATGLSIYSTIGMATALTFVGGLLLGLTVAAWDGVATADGFGGSEQVPAIYAALAVTVATAGAFAADLALATHVYRRLGRQWMLGTQVVIGGFWFFVASAAVANVLT